MIAAIGQPRDDFSAEVVLSSFSQRIFHAEQHIVAVPRYHALMIPHAEVMPLYATDAAPCCQP